MRSFIKPIVLSALVLSAISCGQAEDGADEGFSETESLTGFPCESYGQNLADSRFFCSSVVTGGRTVQILYRLDGFTSTQMTKLKSALRIAGERFSAHFTIAQPSALVSCINRNVSNSLDPVGSTLSTTFKDINGKSIWALTTLNLGFGFHADNKIPIQIKSFSEPLNAEGSTAAARAFIGNDKLPVTITMDFSVNKVALDQPDNAKFDYSANAFAGAIIHEMLHTRGYTHPEEGRSVGPMVYEIGNCISDSSTTSLSLTSRPRKPLPNM